MIKMYYAHIFSHINYGIVIWGSMLNSSSLQDLCRAQKACLCIINKKKKNAPTNELFRKNWILKLLDIIKLELIKFGYRLSRNDLPGPIKNIMNDKGGCKMHGYPTRNKSIRNIQPHTCMQFNMRYLCKGPTTFGGQSLWIKRSSNTTVLVKQCKQHIISKY